MGSLPQYAFGDGRRANFCHQDSHTKLLRNTSASSDMSGEDAVFAEETFDTLLSIRSGSDQGDSPAASFLPRVSQAFLPQVSFPRRHSLQERRLQPGKRRPSLQNRPLLMPPTPFNNVDHAGRLQKKSTGSTSSSSDDHQFASSWRDVDLPHPAYTSPEPKNKWRSRCSILFAVVVCGLSVCASLLSVYSYYVMVFDVHHDQIKYCLPCSDLTKPPKDVEVPDYQMATKVAAGQEMCCVNSSDGLSRLVAKTQKYEQMNQASSQNMTSAHVGLYADTKDLETIRGHIHYILHFSTESSLQYCQNVIVENDRLSILISGLYFVYVSIHYSLDTYKKTCKEMEHKTWLHRIYSNRTEGKNFTVHWLLRSEHTCCEDCSEDRTSRFTGGVFDLHAGDKIFVAVSAPSMVVDSYKTNYLGLFLINTKTDSLQKPFR